MALRLFLERAIISGLIIGWLAVLAAQGTPATAAALYVPPIAFFVIVYSLNPERALHFGRAAVIAFIIQLLMAFVFLYMLQAGYTLRASTGVAAAIVLLGATGTWLVLSRQQIRLSETRASAA